jgi:hypothetical protein
VTPLRLARDALRRPTGPRGPLGSVADSLARRRAARAPRVRVLDPGEAGRQPRALDPDDPARAELIRAAEALILAAQRGSRP